VSKSDLKGKMEHQMRTPQLQEKLYDLKSKISLLLPMIRCCKDELNDLTLQEMEIRSAIRSKLKQEQLDPLGEGEDETPDQIMGLSQDMDLEEEEADEEKAAVAEEVEEDKSVDYREFLTLDPKIIKVDSDEEEDDDDEDRDDLSEEDCGNVLLADDDDN